MRLQSAALDLLQNSVSEPGVDESGDELETQREPFAAVPIGLFADRPGRCRFVQDDDAPHFERADDVKGGRPETSERVIKRLVVRAEFLAPQLFAAQAALRVSGSESLIAAVGDDPDVRAQVRVLRSEQAQVMRCAGCMSGRENLLAYDVDDDLTF